MARDLVAEIRQADGLLAALTTQISQAVTKTGTGLVEADGVGPVVAGRLLSRVGRPGPFPTAVAFANYAGVAPVQVASADKSWHRLARGDDGRLNMALHIVALTQERMTNSTGRRYYDTNIAAG